MNTPDLNQRITDWTATLHQEGLRVTQPRLQVMRILAESEIPLTPQDIYQLTLDLDSPPGIASVYRTLEMLGNLGLTMQIHQPGGCHAICPAVEGHKHLLICSTCGQMRVVEGNEGISEYINKVEEETGYRVEEHWLQLFGTCQNCS
jgi:Fe2+ or Zn2+ uptake regulation protein